MASSDAGLDLDPDMFGPLLDIPDEKVVRLARSIALLHADSLPENGRVVKKIDGGFNLDFVVAFGGFKLVVRVPAYFGDRWTTEAALSMRSEVATLKLIRQKTRIPVPEVYGFDLTFGNEIGQPYICMSFLTGDPVSEVWHDKKGGKKGSDNFRLKILTSVARTMAQLSAFTFDQIGCIVEVPSNPGKVTIGPLFTRDLMEENPKVTTAGPFDTVSEYLEFYRLVPNEHSDPWEKSCAKVLDVLVDCLPKTDRRFVLELPGCDSTNILVDQDGKVTGVTDWDFAQTVPGFVGYAKYPGWLTRDWDPVLYRPDLETEDSPFVLEEYRNYYANEMEAALARNDDLMSASSQYTRKSHIYEAIWIALHSKMCRYEICRKFIQTALGISEQDAYGEFYLLDVYSEEEWEDFEAKLREVVNAPPVPSIGN
ncbi:hypothetical protein QBC41DRAFT_325577 [Cercophora samala]|uniref:Aminoglycoside phosphotransferase domain-containing protein n=1 Tax=Cercophora samala TaxID=330535 RepID=A0AA39ZAE6_9PEZI|nr:hypothetical protein QBC41DRAFT_325577 [Cercophora samala]